MQRVGDREHLDSRIARAPTRRTRKSRAHSLFGHVAARIFKAELPCKAQQSALLLADVRLVDSQTRRL